MVGEEEAFTGGELADDVGGEDLAGLGAGADAGGELDGGAEEVALFGDGLAGVEADADADGVRGFGANGEGRIRWGERLLDGDGAVEGAAGGAEGGMMPSPVCLISLPP